jgi:hypothetical protein
MIARRRTSARFTALAALTCLAVALPALADDVDAPKVAAARSLFDDAMRLTEAGKHAEACPKFAESNRLDPGMGVKYRLAICYENTARLASAWALFTQVADEAAAARMSEREKVARGRAEALKLRLPRMIVLVPEEVAKTPGLEVKRDGELVRPAMFGTSIPVDSGQHVVSVSAPGKRQWETTAQASEAATITVTVPVLQSEPEVGPIATATATAAATTTAMATPVEADAPAGWGGRHTAGAVIAGVGLVAIGIGAGFGADATGKHNASKAACPARRECSPNAIELENAARGSATGSTAALIAGGVALAGGAVLFLTAGWPFGASGAGEKKSGAAVTVRATAQGAMMTIQGGF